MKFSSRGTRRLFFAIDFDSATKENLAKWCSTIDINGRRIDPENYHVTLQYLGNLPHHQIAELIESIKIPQMSNYNIDFSTVGYFAKAEALYLEIKQGKEQTIKLARSLVNNYRHLKLKHKENKTFVPHVTIAREVKPPLDPVYQGSVTAPVKDFCLMESITIKSGVYYKVVEQWRLNTPSEKSIMLGIEEK